MRIILSISFALLMLLQPLSRVWIFLSFKWQQPYIAKQLCVQKEVKNNCCEGKCQLKKQIKESRQEEQKAPNRSEEKIEVIFCNALNSWYLFGFNAEETATQIWIDHNGQTCYAKQFVPLSLTTRIFHPPKTA